MLWNQVKSRNPICALAFAREFDTNKCFRQHTTCVYCHKTCAAGFCQLQDAFSCSRRTPEFPLLLFLLVLVSKLLAVQTTEWYNNHFYCLHSSVEYKCPSVRSETFACGMCEQNVLVGRVPVLPYMWPAVKKQVVQAVQEVQAVQTVQGVQVVQAVHNKTISPNQRYHFQCKLEHLPFSYMWLLERSFLLMCSRI